MFDQMNYFRFDPHSERIQAARRRLAAAYARQPGAPVPIVDLCAAPASISVQDCFDDNEAMLKSSVGWANAFASVDSDWPPFLDAFCTIPMVPEAFGSELRFRDGDIAVKPVVDDIRHVWSLKPKPMEETRTIRRMFDWIDFAQRKLGTDVPVWTADIQSPFSVAAQIVAPSELMIACTRKPKAVHHLCRMITDFTLEMMQM